MEVSGRESRGRGMESRRLTVPVSTPHVTRGRDNRWDRSDGGQRPAHQVGEDVTIAKELWLGAFKWSRELDSMMGRGQPFGEREMFLSYAHSFIPRILPECPLCSTGHLGISEEVAIIPSTEPQSRPPRNWRTIIPKKFLHCCECSRPHNRFLHLGIWQRD